MLSNLKRLKKLHESAHVHSYKKLVESDQDDDDKIQDKILDNIREQLEDCDDDDFVSYVGQANLSDIFLMDEFNDIFAGKEPLDIARVISDDFNTDQNYFKFDGYGCVHSFNYIDKDDYIDDLVDYIYNHERDFNEFRDCFDVDDGDDDE